MDSVIDTPRPDAARPGDWLQVSRPDVSPPRRRQILELLGGPGHAHVHVRWDEERESLPFHAADGVTLERHHAEHPKEDRR
jgi:Domain of unknown function (DUF1918)